MSSGRIELQSQSEAYGKAVYSLMLSLFYIVITPFNQHLLYYNDK